MSKLFIASQEIASGYEHTYLVYDPDGNPNSGDEKVFNGYPSNFPIPSGTIEIANWVPINETWDFLNGDDPFTDRNYTEVETNGKTPEQVKDEISQFAQNLGVNEGEAGITDIPYTSPIEKIFDPNTAQKEFEPALNSNTTIKSGLEKAGIDFESNTPIEGGQNSGNARIPADAFPGAESFFSGEGGTVVIPESSKGVIIYNTGGNNTYEITPSPFGTGTIYIVEDHDTGTTDRLVFKNIDPSDLSFKRTLGGHLEIYFPWDAVGHPSVVIPNQWDSNGVPRMNTIWVEPSEGGTPFVLPLNNPEDFPIPFPQPVPSWVPDALDPINEVGGVNPGAGGINVDPSSPLVIDLDGSGTIDLISLANSQTYFDFRGDGFAEKMGWVAPGDGFLVRDLNGNGQIDGVAEMFGTPYPLDYITDSNWHALAEENGFAQLALLDAENNNENVLTKEV